MELEPPDSDAYGRVTNPGRYAVVGEEADALVDPGTRPGFGPRQGGGAPNSSSRAS